MTQVLGSLSLTWEIQMQLLTAGFGLPLPLLLQAVGE